MDCKACNSLQAGQLEMAVLEGTMTISEAAQRLGMTYEAFWQHLKHHKGKNLKISDIVLVLRKLVTRLQLRCNRLLDMPISQGNEKSIATEVRVLKDLVVDIAKLEGLLTESPAVQINNLIMQQTQLTTFLLEHACPECRGKLIAFLESQRKVGQ